MSRRFRPRLSYANVASTLALVIALGGVSYAAVKIDGKNLKSRSVAASKIKKNTLTGTEIKESKVGKVPNAKAADTAGDSALLGGATPTSYRDACPTGATFKNGACYEMALRAAATYPNAVKDCDADGMRVPTFDELESLRLNGVTVGAPNNNYELSSTFKSIGVVISIDASSNQFDTTYGTAKQYRCVGLPTNAPG
ncbi:MAG: hypothetical protein QOH76_417 [Thermoleophilaceae bacterium]|jgi:hypothetical protein|nr:hypothetical protein [Thermoleophilaceae bacterium]